MKALAESIGHYFKVRTKREFPLHYLTTHNISEEDREYYDWNIMVNPEKLMRRYE